MDASGWSSITAGSEQRRLEAGIDGGGEESCAEALEAVEGVVEAGLVGGADAESAGAGLVVAEAGGELLGAKTAAGVGDGVEGAIHHAAVEEMAGELDAAGADGGQGHLARGDGAGDGLLELEAKAFGGTTGEHEFVERRVEHF